MAAASFPAGPPPPFGAPGPRSRDPPTRGLGEIEGGDWAYAGFGDAGRADHLGGERKAGLLSTAASAAQLVLGLALGACSLYYLLFTGLFLALGQIAVGASGIVASLSLKGISSVSRRQLLIAHLTGGIVVLLLGSSFVAQLGRDVAVECSLAELYLEVGELRQEAANAGPSTQEMFSLVSGRLNQLDEQIQDSAHQLSKAFDEKQKAEKLRHSDAQYIKGKIDLLRKHAHAILDDPSLADPEGAGLNRMPEEARRQLEERLDAAETILDRVAMHDEGHEGTITAGEYQELLQALTQAWVSPASPEAATGPPPDATELVHAARELPVMRAAMHRRAHDLYQATPEPSSILEHQRKMSEAKQRLWAEAFSAARRGREGRAQDLGSLPEHCLEDEAARDAIILMGLAGLVAQALQLYFASTVLTRVALKDD